MRFVVEIDESVYEPGRIHGDWLEQTINVELDDCFSPYIKVVEVTPGSELDKAIRV